MSIIWGNAEMYSSRPALDVVTSLKALRSARIAVYSIYTDIEYE